MSGLQRILGLARGPKAIAVADPAANAEFSHVVPVGKFWQLIAVSVLLVQGAVDTPQPILVVDDGATTLLESFGASAVQAINTSTRYTWAPDMPLSGQVGAGANVHATAPIPEGIILAPGFRVRSSTLGLGANSNYGAPSLYVVEYGS